MQTKLTAAQNLVDALPDARRRRACCRARRSARRSLATAAPAARSSRASARPCSRRRRAAARRRDGCSAAASAIARSARRQQRRDAPPAPGAAEVQAVEMRDLAVAAVADDRRREQGRGLARCDARQEVRRTSCGNAAGCVRAMHSASISAGDRNSSPPGSHAWQSRSAPNQCRARSADQLGERGVEALRPFQRQDQREGGVEMRADADRIGEHREIAAQPLGEGARQRLELCAPRIVVPRRFEVQVQQPRPAIGPLEPATERPVEIGELRRRPSPA